MADDVLVARLREELGQPVVDVERALPVERAVGAVQPAERAQPAAVVPPVLASGQAVQVEVHAQPVLAAPLDRAQQVPPRRAEEIRVAVVRLDRPVREGDAHVVEPGVADLPKRVLGHEGRVVLFENALAARAEVLTEGVLVDDAELAVVVEE